VIKYLHNSILSLTICFLAFGCNQSQDVDGLSSITPLGIVPDPQNGYGSGVDQLAQPDDVELLSDGSMVISDVSNNLIKHFSDDGVLLKSVSAKDLGLEDGQILPTGISKDSSGFIYITLEGVGLIARLNPDLTLDQFIGKKCDITADNYYNQENDGCLIAPQGIIVADNGDVYVVDMAKEVFKVKKIRNFGIRKFKQVKNNGTVSYIYDRDFAATQEITAVMRKSEGMAISENQKTIFIAEEKPQVGQFGNVSKKRYVAAFNLEDGRFLDRLIGVTMNNDSIVSGYFNDSVEGICTFGNNLFVVDEKAGQFYIFDIRSGKYKGSIGKKAYYYCNYKSDCVIDGINYNEHSIIAGLAKPHLKNDWRKNELASPDGISTAILADGSSRLAIVDQWNSRILMYDLDKILKDIE